jgi:molybdate transport system substrate-binding protein
LSVLAASSLTEAFSQLERTFEAARPGLDVSLAFGGSQVLSLQIEQGAPADVFASADRSHIDALLEAGAIEQAVAFAGNDLVVIVPADNPAHIASFDDLVRATRIVVGTPNVPIGAYTRELLRRAASTMGEAFATTVRSRVVSEESNTRLVRAKIEMGEADAAIVYRTDALASDRVRVVSIPESINVRANYYIGALKRSSRPDACGDFIAHVRSDAGQRILSQHGFVTEP